MREQRQSELVLFASVGAAACLLVTPFAIRFTYSAPRSRPESAHACVVEQPRVSPSEAARAVGPPPKPGTASPSAGSAEATLTKTVRDLWPTLTRKAGALFDRRPSAANVALADAQAVARSISGYFYAGEREEGERFAAQNGAHAFDALPKGVVADATFDDTLIGGPVFEIRISRLDVSRPLIAYSPPGVYGEPVEPALRPVETPEGRTDFRVQQDLAILSAPVLVLRPGERCKSMRVRVACASFRGGSPEWYEQYRLRRFPRSSPIDAVMVALCTGEPECERTAQLSIWIARNDVARDEILAHPSLSFLGESRRLIRRESEAAELLIRAGVELETRRFFHVVPPVSRETPKAAPAAARAPTT